eukprot:1187240-Prorocentrum_minimum.AAC.5
MTVNNLTGEQIRSKGCNISDGGHTPGVLKRAAETDWITVRHPMAIYEISVGVECVVWCSHEGAC